MDSTLLSDDFIVELGRLSVSWHMAKGLQLKEMKLLLSLPRSVVTCPRIPARVAGWALSPPSSDQWGVFLLVPLDGVFATARSSRKHSRTRDSRYISCVSFMACNV